MPDFRKDLKLLEKRDWWLWWASITVMLSLTSAVIVLTLPTLLKETDRNVQLNLNLAVHALVGLVLLFNVYTVYQQMLIKRLRKQMAENIEAMALLKVRAEEFHKLAVLDPLTGLYNRRLAEQRLAGEVSRSQRYGHPLTLLLFDLNDFKQINDHFGHAAGDLVLRTFAERLTRVTRTSDLAVRLGGDEFMVLLTECPPEQAPRLLSRLAPLEVSYQGSRIAVRFAAGWVGYQPGETAEQMLERADRALYTNKRTSSLALLPSHA